MSAEVDLGLAWESGAPEWFAARSDPRGPKCDPIELEDLREDVDGIASTRHPETLLLTAPSIRPVVDMWHAGLAHELTRLDYADLSNFEVECWLTMRAAHSREEARRIRIARETPRD